MAKCSLVKATGFTVVEMVITVTLIGILAGVSFAVSRSQMFVGQDAERRGDAESIARAFEASYNFSTTANGPTYPTTDQAADQSTYDTLFRGNDREITRAPGANSGTSIVAAASAAQPQAPTFDQYIYQPYTATNALCTTASGALCVRFTLYYHTRDPDVIKQIESVHQQ